MLDKPYWHPSQESLANSAMTRFSHILQQRYSLPNTHYQTIHQWSIKQPESFWSEVWQYCRLQGTLGTKIYEKTGKQFWQAQWFPDSTLNFAANLLKRNDDGIAIQYANENGDRATWRYHELHHAVGSLAQYLLSLGIQSGDRICGVLANTPETVIAMLATTLIGAIWTACSPEFGIPAITERFEQIKPTLCFYCGSHQYNGKHYQHSALIDELPKRIPSLQSMVLLTSQTLSDIQNQYPPLAIEKQPQHPFDHPVYIVYSSGTTGQPKCIVHGAGGTLLQHQKELQLHCDINANSTLFFYTTCSWMMWHWLVSGLACGSTIVLYDGSPFYPKHSALFDLIDELNIQHFGVGAKIIESCEKFNLTPSKTHHLSSLQSILTTGSPLLTHSYDYISQHIKKNIRISSMSGGTDILSCFALGNPTLPVYRGELQCIGLGMDVHIYNNNGQPVIAEKGELVCCSPFPSMPVGFWNDPYNEKYQAAYFDTFANVWTHGDYAEITPHHGLIIYGRSDATLNPGGVRIGSAEIYRQVDTIPEVTESLAVAKDTQEGEVIYLFVVLAANIQLNEALSEKIKTVIRAGTTPRHVPQAIFQVPELPRTFSGKVVELAVKAIINNKPIRNLNAISNPSCLEAFKPAVK